jgi:hypothetical protein
MWARLPALLFALPLMAASAAAQTAPPIQGVTGTVATDSTIRNEHDAARKVAGSVARAAKKILPGGTATDQNPLDALIVGTRVVVREAAGGGDAAKTATGGVVIDVNRSRKQITIRSADNKAHTLRVMDGTGAPPAPGTHVVVSLADQAGARTYDFTRVS